MRPSTYKRVETLLRLHCHREGAFATYDYGWSDVRVAEHGYTTQYVVRRIRQQLLGKKYRHMPEELIAQVNSLHDGGYSRKEIVKATGLSGNAVGGITFRHRKRRPKLPDVSLWKGFQ